VSRPRLRLERAQRKASDRWVLDKDQTHHLVHVRRCVEGDRVEGLLDGRLFLLKLAFEDGYLCGVLEKELPATRGENLWLLLALLKMDAFEQSLRMATESGACNIVPLLCERSVVRLDEKRWLSKQKRWTKIIEESTKQARVPQRPVLYEPMSVGSAMSLPLPEDRYAAMLRKDAKLLVDCAPSGGAVFAVGPEGDWAHSECETLSAGGFTAVSLGRRIMKSPTAVAVGLGFLSMRLEQYYEN